VQQIEEIGDNTGDDEPHADLVHGRLFSLPVIKVKALCNLRFRDASAENDDIAQRGQLAVAHSTVEMLAPALVL